MMVWHPLTIACVEHRIAQGLTKRDIIRGPNRFVDNEHYQVLPDLPAAPPQEYLATT